MTKPLLAILLLFSFVAASSHASGFLQNKGDWARRSLEEQLGYVMGHLDGYLYVVTKDEADKRYKAKVRKCTREEGITNYDLVEIVEMHYERLEHFRDSPSLALINGLIKVCGLSSPSEESP